MSVNRKDEIRRTGIDDVHFPDLYMKHSGNRRACPHPAHRFPTLPDPDKARVILPACAGPAAWLAALNGVVDRFREVERRLGDDLVAEIGATQAEAVAGIAADARFATELRRDLGGRPRALVLRRTD